MPLLLCIVLFLTTQLAHACDPHSTVNAAVLSSTESSSTSFDPTIELFCRFERRFHNDDAIIGDDDATFHENLPTRDDVYYAGIAQPIVRASVEGMDSPKVGSLDENDDAIIGDDDAIITEDFLLRGNRVVGKPIVEGKDSPKFVRSNKDDKAIIGGDDADTPEGLSIRDEGEDAGMAQPTGRASVEAKDSRGVVNLNKNNDAIIGDDDAIISGDLLLRGNLVVGMVEPIVTASMVEPNNEEIQTIRTKSLRAADRDMDLDGLGDADSNDDLEHNVIMHSDADADEEFTSNTQDAIFGRVNLEDLEAEFEKIPSREAARTTLEFLTKDVHMAGTRKDFELAQSMLDMFLKAHLDEAWIETVPVLLSYPSMTTRSRVAAFSTSDSTKSIYEAKLSEDVVKSDRSSSKSSLRNHTFNGYSPSGSVRGKLVYANFGTPEDFELLRKHNVTVRNRIVLVRYGKCFRGLKVMNAQARGAIGVIIYSDPHEDGFSVGLTYPEGPWRSVNSVQRGSIQFNSLCSGDVARIASGNDTLARCGYESTDLYPKIPTLPMSWGDASPLLQLIKGKIAPKGFTGALPLTYRLGQTDGDVLLETHNNFVVGKIPNAFAVLKSRHFGTAKDRPIIIGNHRDAWTFGAVDPGSGTAALVEVARGLGHLRQKFPGWRPSRTLLFASWSGEELGLLGSTAFVEKHADTFLKHTVAYLNVDVGVSGTKFELAGTATLAKLIAHVLSHVKDPEATNTSLSARWDGLTSPLGTGSDYTAFIHTLGISSVDMRFSPVNGTGKDSGTAYGTYHSMYDSIDWMLKFGDPKFAYHQAMAIVWGKVALHLSESHILPFDHVTQAQTILKYVEKTHHMISNLATKASLQHAAGRFLVVSKMVEKKIESIKRAIANHPRIFNYGKLERLNDALAFAEREFLLSEGLPKRKFYKHSLQAPSLYLGYAPDILPGITQAFRDERNPALANHQAKLFTERLNAVSKMLSSAICRIHRGAETLEKSDDNAAKIQMVTS